MGTKPSPLALADMSVPQLEEAQRALGEAQGRYDNLSGICATLRGLTLLEIKRKLTHGKWMPWVKKHFEKDHTSATRCMRIAEDFISRLQTKNTPESKLCTRAQFDAQQLLLSDLATNLSAIENARLDMSHPVVAAVAAYADGKSYRQLLLALGDAPKGGDVGRRDENGKKIQKKRITKGEQDEAAAQEWAKLAIPALVHDYQSGIWRMLPDVGLANFADILKRLSKEADEVCRARGIVPSKLADWDQNPVDEEDRI